jgi:hypothetical protein
MLVILSLWWSYEVMRGDTRYLIPAVVVLALAGGVRQQTIVFLAPTFLFALRRVGWKRFLAAGVLGAVICLAWFIPLMTLSDGFGTYMRVMGAYNRRFQNTTSVFMGAGMQGIGRNVRKLTLYSLYGWNLALVPGLAYVARRLLRREWPQSWERPTFFLLWVGPALFFYTVVHMGQQGLVFVFLPALLLLSALGLTRFLAAQPRWLTAAATALLVLNVSIFVLAPEYPLGSGTQRLLTRATVVNSDRYYQDRFEAIERHFAPESAAILADNWHHVEHYLPEYAILKGENIHDGSPESSVQVVTPAALGLQPDAERRVIIVVFDAELSAFNQSLTSVRELSLGGGDALSYFVLSGDQSFYYGAGAFGLSEG